MQYKGTSTNQKQPVKSGAWTGLKIADGASYSILTAPHASFNSQVDLRVSGLPVGAVLQARFAIYDTAKKAYTVNYPIQEIHGSTGDAFGSLSLNNAITSEGKLLRVRFIGPDGATIVSASARTIYSA